jgi:hypothetical protein
VRRVLSLVIATAVAAATLSGAAAALALAAYPGETAYALGVTALTDLVVDTAHGHVYVTGTGVDGVLVRDLAGAPVTTLTGQTGAAGMALSDDGTSLYVALAGADAISAVDTTTLAETGRWSTGASTCPLTVGELGSQLWFTYGCNTYNRVGVVERSGDAPVTSLARDGVEVNSADELLVAADNRVVVHDRTYSEFQVYDVTGTTLAPVANRKIGDSAVDLALSADRTQLVVAAHNAEYTAGAYSLPGLTAVRPYGTRPYQAGVATAPGYVATESGNWPDHDVEVWTEAGAHVRSYDLDPCCGDTHNTPTIVLRGLALAPDASRLYAVTGSYGQQLWLHALPDVTKHLSAVTLAQPLSGKVNTAFKISGHVTAETAIPAGAVVHVTRSSKWGTVQRPDVKTGTGGAFTITDTVYKRGQYAYRATWDGDATRAGASGVIGLTVAGAVPPLTVTTDRRYYTYGQQGRVTAHLGATHDNRTVQILTHPYGGYRTSLKTGPVDGNGYLSTTLAMKQGTTVSAYFAGDDVYEPRTVLAVVGVHVIVYESLSGYYGTSGAYRLYHRSVDPRITATFAPRQSQVCATFRAERFYANAWHFVTKNDCIPLNQNSQAIGILVGDPVVGSPYRLNVTYAGGGAYETTTGAWLYLRFT